MPDVSLIASTLILVETTLYAVAVAVYTLLVQRGRLSPWDRLLVELLGQPAFEEVASKIVDMVYRKFYVIWISLAYMLALVGGFWSMATQDLTGAAIGASLFAPAYGSFLFAVEVLMPRTVKQIIEEIPKSEREG